MPFSKKLNTNKSIKDFSEKGRVQKNVNFFSKTSISKNCLIESHHLGQISTSNKLSFESYAIKLNFTIPKSPSSGISIVVLVLCLHVNKY